MEHNKYHIYIDNLHVRACISVSGQNKNQFVIGYFMWRVMTGRHTQLEYLMQVPGHARCLVDGGFASLKRLYRRTDCDSIDQLEEVVNKSSSTNTAVRYPAWKWRDWNAFLGPVFRAVPGIRYFFNYTPFYVCNNYLHNYTFGSHWFVPYRYNLLTLC